MWRDAAALRKDIKQAVVSQVAARTGKTPEFTWNCGEQFRGQGRQAGVTVPADRRDWLLGQLHGGKRSAPLRYSHWLDAARRAGQRGPLSGALFAAAVGGANDTVWINLEYCDEHQ